MTSSQLDAARIAARLRAELSALAGDLPSSDIESIRLLIEAGEWAIALDAICTQVYEYDVPLETAQRSSLIDLGNVLDVPVSYLLGDPWASRDEAARDIPDS